MRVLVVGSGGREHALCWAIAGSPILDKLWCAPGNPGTAQVAENLPFGVMDATAVVAFARDNAVDLVISALVWQLVERPSRALRSGHGSTAEEAAPVGAVAVATVVAAGPA